MRIPRVIATALCASSALALTACDLSGFLTAIQPVAPPSTDYVGEWETVGVDLVIYEDGTLSYETRSGNLTKTLNAPILTWGEQGFDAGIGPIVVEFTVNEAPHLDGDIWKMTVNGKELERPTRLASYPFAGRDMSR